MSDIRPGQIRLWHTGAWEEELVLILSSGQVGKDGIRRNEADAWTFMTASGRLDWHYDRYIADGSEVVSEPVRGTQTVLQWRQEGQ